MTNNKGGYFFFFFGKQHIYICFCVIYVYKGIIICFGLKYWRIVYEKVYMCLCMYTQVYIITVKMVL